MKRTITIGREFGSGGRELGRRLAEALGIEYYDKEIIDAVAKHTSLSEDYVHKIIDRKPHALFPITVGQSMSYMENYYFQQVQSVYQAQTEIIKDLAAKAPSVMVGRGADAILKDENPFRIFVYADFDYRVKRCMERKEAPVSSEKEAKRMVNEIDKNRAKYYEFYSNQRWGDKLYYDLCINTTDVVIKDIVPPLAEMLKAYL